MVIIITIVLVFSITGSHGSNNYNCNGISITGSHGSNNDSVLFKMKPQSVYISCVLNKVLVPIFEIILWISPSQ